MSYSLEKMRVENMFFVPGHFFVPDAVEKRKALSENARRAGWIGCNILLDKIPVQGRIAIVKDGIVLDRTDVLNQVKLAQMIKIENIADRGWLMDILHCVNAIASDVFTLDEIYFFELQQLRDRGIISFLGRGRYQKNEHF